MSCGDQASLVLWVPPAHSASVPDIQESANASNLGHSAQGDSPQNPRSIAVIEKALARTDGELLVDGIDVKRGLARFALYANWEKIQADPLTLDCAETDVLREIDEVDDKPYFESPLDRGSVPLPHTLSNTAVTFTPRRPLRRLCVLISRRLYALGRDLLDQYNSNLELNYLHLSISIFRLAVNLVGELYPFKAACLSALGLSLWTRYERLGELGDIEQAIKAERCVIEHTPDGHAYKALYLNNLGDSLICRFERLGNTVDLEDGIQAHRHAVDLVPDSYSMKPMLLVNLATSLMARFGRFQEVPDLEERWMIEFRALKLIPDHHLRAPSRLIPKIAQPSDLIPNVHPNNSRYLTNLATALGDRSVGAPDEDRRLDVDRAVVVRRAVVELTPDGHKDKAAYNMYLGALLSVRFSELGRDEDFVDAFGALIQAASSELSSISPRLRAIRYLESLCWRNLQIATYDRLIQVYTQALSLIPQAASLAYSIGQRYDELLSLGDMAVTAAAVAVSTGRLGLAVEWLETGRGVVWGQVLQLRTPLDELQKLHPHLAERLRGVIRVLENSDGNDFTQTIRNDTYFPVRYEDKPQPINDRSRAQNDYKTIVAQIRRQDGFERFFLQKTLSELAPAPCTPPIVMIYVHKSRSDALILWSPDSIVHVPLSSLSEELVDKMHLGLMETLDKARIRGRGLLLKPSSNGDSRIILWILEKLWTLIVNPILQVVERDYPEKLRVHGLPRVTWCATGRLASLPLHAAGIYQGPQSLHSANKAYSRVLSSYTPTLSALSHSISKTLPAQAREPMTILAVSQPRTPGFAPLPATTQEVNRIKKYFPSNRLVHLDDEAATRDAVLSAMDEHHPQVLHLACHGIQDHIQPTNSAFMLHDEPLSLASLMTRSTAAADLAFLSACQTAAGDDKLPEEALHLAAGMLTMGFKAVIGTMWSIKDEDAPLVADEVYAHLADSGQERDMDVAYALHKAVGRLREEIGENAFLRWIPFVHFGQ